MKKILLLRTYTEILGRAISPPLGLMYLASAVREYGLRRRIDFDFKLLDLNLYGQDIRDRLGDVRAFAPHVVGITGMSYEAAAMHQTAAVLKKNLPEVRIVFGGPYASVSPLKCMQDANVDFVVVGEGEETFPDLLDSILFRSKPYQDVPGIVFRGTNGDSARTEPRGYREDVDQIPFPAWDLLDMEAYFNTERWHYFQADRRYMPIYTSRACPYRCVYCHHLFGKKFRPRSPENVFREMRYLSDAYGIKEFQIFDDAFNVQVSRAEGICDLIIRSGMKIFMTFPNGVRGDIMTDGLLEKLRRAGTYKIAYAIETASPRLQKLIKKNKIGRASCRERV